MLAQVQQQHMSRVAAARNDLHAYLSQCAPVTMCREGYSAFILAADNSTTPQPAAAAAASNSTPTPPSPSPPAAAAPPKDTVQVSAPAPTAPATAAAAGGGGGGGGCTLAAWAQCGGQGGDCASGKPGYKCADAPYSGCACPADNPCQRKVRVAAAGTADAVCRSLSSGS